MARCLRCLSQKKGCSGGRPCDRCVKAGIGPEGCIPKTDGRRSKKVLSELKISATSSKSINEASIAQSQNDGIAARGVQRNRDSVSYPVKLQRRNILKLHLNDSTLHRSGMFDQKPLNDKLANEVVKEPLNRLADERTPFSRKESPSEGTDSSRDSDPDRSTSDSTSTASSIETSKSSVVEMISGLEVDESGMAHLPSFLRKPGGRKHLLPTTKNFAHAPPKRSNRSASSFVSLGQEQRALLRDPDEVLIHNSSLSPVYSFSRQDVQIQTSTQARDDLTSQKSMTQVRPLLDDLLYQPRQESPSSAVNWRELLEDQQGKWNEEVKEQKDQDLMTVDPQLLVRHFGHDAQYFWREPVWFEEHQICRYCEQALSHHAVWCQDDPITAPQSMRKK